MTSHGEAFNPVLLGGRDKATLLGMDRAARDADPHALLDRIAAAPGLTGFRYFHDHDPRVRDRILGDHRIAKVILTRDPLDSYLSLEIARATDQWRVTDPSRADRRRIRFDPAEFDALRQARETFRDRVRNSLRRSGQVGFELDYEDILSLDMINGLAAYLGLPDRLTALPARLKRQNPGPPDEKVENPKEMRAHLSATGHAIRDPRPPLIYARQMLVAARSPILAIPLPGGPTDAIRAWLRALDGTEPSQGLDQKALRGWMRRHPGFASISIVRHPVARAHRLWRGVVEGRDIYGGETRDELTRGGRVIPGSYGISEIHELCEAREGGRVWPAEEPELGLPNLRCCRRRRASRSCIASLENEEAPATLYAIGGHSGATFASADERDLADVVDDTIEDLCHDLYRRDYRQFGFGRWADRQAACEEVGVSVRTV